MISIFMSKIISVHLEELEPGEEFTLVIYFHAFLDRAFSGQDF
jgi:hypothetical protein